MRPVSAGPAALFLFFVIGCATNTSPEQKNPDASPAGETASGPGVFSMDEPEPPAGAELPEPAEPAADFGVLMRETVTYSIMPDNRIDDVYGYIGLEYRTARETVEDKIKVLNVDPGDSARQAQLIKETPAGGIITININRKELLHANTKWYSYSLQFANDNDVLRRKGAESIPFVKGREDLWWNTDIMPVQKPLENSLTLCVEDSKIGRKYCFTITRQVTYEELRY